MSHLAHVFWSSITLPLPMKIRYSTDLVVISVFRRREKEDLGNYRLIWIPGKLRLKPFPRLEAISKHIKDKKVAVSGHHGFVKEKCLTNLTATYNRISASMDVGTAVDTVCLNLNKTFFSVFPNIFYKQMKYRLYKWQWGRLKTDWTARLQGQL